MEGGEASDDPYAWTKSDLGVLAIGAAVALVKGHSSHDLAGDIVWLKPVRQQL